MSVEYFEMAIGILAFGIAFVVYMVFNTKKTLKLKEEEIEKYKAALNHLQTQHLFNEEKLKELQKIKDSYEEVFEENILNGKQLQELRIKYENALEKIDEQKKELEHLKTKNDLLNEKNATLAMALGECKTKLAESEKNFEEKIQIIKSSEERLKESFENLANEVLKKAGEKIKTDSKESLETILSPLKTQMKEFREKIESLNKDEAEKISALQNELKNLKELSYKLSNDAENLTKALKGESKTQGLWGEMVLEKVLDLSGLKEGREYDREVSLRNDEQKTYRPDVIIHLPNGRDIIIDAKTSLNAYSEYIKTEDKSYIKAHIQALKTHVDSLAQKRYENLEGVNSLDFVFMFVPIENALLLALENDAELFEYAFRKRVVLVSPSTLLISLRAIESSWRFEKQAKNIEEVVKAAEALYDKVRGFSEDFEKIGKSLNSAVETYEKAKNKLTSGRGNVIRQIVMLKEKAGIKPKKEISKELTQMALLKD